ncbi:MAG: tetratricopeptide repeat protein, partial [Chitinispirillaceae bacterium]|nr:tetratricopeptide repeat protein [Chitinispirillaceae bacterium]
LLGGIVDHRSDICSLGIMLYEMLTFKNPYLDQRNLHQTTINVMEANPIPPRKLVPWLPAEIEAITLKAMAKSPSDRYQTMAEFKDDIERYQKGEPVKARPISIWIKTKHFAKKNWAPLVIGGLIILFLVITGISIYFQKKRGQSHWQLVYSENFDSVTNLDEWVLSPSADSNKIWEIKNGYLRSNSPHLSYARLNRRFNRDIRIECDIVADSIDIYNCGIYLFADHPDSGYVFHLNAGGNGNYGVSFPESKFIFLDAYPSSIPFSNVNHIVIEKIQNAVTYSINGLIVAKIWDFMPPLGREHEHFGFFTNRSNVRFDNLKIYRRAIPEAPSPTLIADRFAEKGDFEGAIEEYKGLLLDFENSEITPEIYLKMAECLVRLDRLDEAVNILDNKINSKNRDETFKARLLLLKSIIQSKKDNIKASDSLLQLIASKYPTNPVNIYGMIKVILQCTKAIEEGRLGDAYKEIELMNNSYKKISSQWGKLHLYLMESYINSKKYDSAFVVVSKIKKGFATNDYLVSSAKIGEGRIFLNKGQKDKAN